MQTSQNDNAPVFNQKKEAEGKFPEKCSSDIFINNGILTGVSYNSSDAGIYGSDKFCTETLIALLVPSGRFYNVSFGNHSDNDLLLHHKVSKIRFRTLSQLSQHSGLAA
ncbi:MAG: hypothetical protein K0A94_06665 [Desulfuromonadales bacterium]|nr:hypothetical protein [Desulfuromonadales bacterium]